jgi:hypothetical protein
MLFGFQGLIFTRVLHEWRKICRPDGPIRQKLFFFASALGVPILILFTWQTCKMIFKHLPPAGEPTVFVVPGILASMLLFYLFLLPELIREIGFAKDLELLRVAPVSTPHWIGYRLVMSLLRIMGFGALVVTFPLYCAWSFSKNPFHLVSFLFLIIACYACLSLLALWTSVYVLHVCNRLRVPRHALFILMSAVLIAGTCLAIPYLLDSASWSKLAHRSSGYDIKSDYLVGFLLLLVVSGYLAYRSTLRLWPNASKPEDHGIRRPRVPFGPRRLFSANHTWAIFQKDLKEHCRNPNYRYSLLVCALLTLYVAAANWIKASSAGPHSWARSMVGLSYIYLIPFFFSARTVSMELPMLQFYRLVYSDPGWVLNHKWRVQSVLNCLVIFALAVPLFFVIGGGAKALEPVYYVCCVIVFTPLFTMLALALGTFFASASIPPNAFGIRPLGGVIYFLLTIIMYSFLLNHMVLGAALYSLFLFPFTVFLYFQARTSLSRSQ